MPDWLSLDSPWVGWLAALSPVLFVGSLLLVPAVVVRMRADYFVSKRRSEAEPAGHPAGRLAVRLAKNALGIVFLFAGLAMLVLPGQGILTLLIALVLLEFPGKRRAELFLVRRPLVLRTINSMRQRYGRAPVELPPRVTGRVIE